MMGRMDALFASAVVAQAAAKKGNGAFVYHRLRLTGLPRLLERGNLYTCVIEAVFGRYSLASS